MRKSLLKTIVATAVVGATMALSSVAAWAASTTTIGILTAQPEGIDADNLIASNAKIDVYATDQGVSGVDTKVDTGYSRYGYKTNRSSGSVTYGSTSIRPVIKIVAKEKAYVQIKNYYNATNSKNWYIIKDNGNETFLSVATGTTGTSKGEKDIAFNAQKNGVYYFGAAGSGSLYVLDVISSEFEIDSKNHKAMYFDGTDAYLVVGITGDESDAATELQILNSTNNNVKNTNTTTVYTGVNVNSGEATLNAADIDAKYVLGMKLNNAAGFTINKFIRNIVSSAS